MSKIIICGLNGSGKSTLGKAISEKINYVHKDVESYYFNNDESYKYSKSRSKEDVTKDIENDFEKYKNIVFTACKGDYGNICSQFDIAIYIKLDKEIRMNRVRQRSYKQFGDRILKDGDLHEREIAFFNKVYRKDESEITNWFESLNCNKIIIDGKNTVNDNVNIVLNKLKNII